MTRNQSFEEDNASVMTAVLTAAEYNNLLKQRRLFLKETVEKFIKSANIHFVPNANREKIIAQCVKALILSDVFNAGTPIDVLEELAPHMSDIVSLQQAINKFNKRIQKYKYQLTMIRRNGTNLRQSYKPRYPELLENGRLAVKIEPIVPLTQQLTDVIDKINEMLPETKRVRFKTTTVDGHTSFYVQDNRNTAQRMGHFLNKIGQDMKKMLADLKSSDWTEAVQSAFIETITKSEHPVTYETTEKGTRSHNIIKMFNVAHKTNIPVSDILFYFTKKAFEQQPTFDFLRLNLIWQCRALTIVKNALTYQQVNRPPVKKDSEDAIDLLVFSKTAADISHMSAYTDYETDGCMCPTETQSSNIMYDIERGTIVVYGVNSRNPHKRLSRILLKPRYGKNKDKIYNIGRIHGRQDWTFLRAVSDYTRENFDSQGSSVVFRLVPKLYPDNDPLLVYRGESLKELCKHKEIPYHPTKNGIFIHGVLETDDLSPEMNIDYDKLYVSWLNVNKKMPETMPYAEKVVIGADVPLIGVLDLHRCQKVVFNPECNLSQVQKIILSESATLEGVQNFPVENIVRKESNKEELNKIKICDSKFKMPVHINGGHYNRQNG